MPSRAARSPRSERSPCSCCSSTRRCTTRSSKYSPHRLCTYLFDLAQSFTAFYEACPVLKAEPTSTRAFRLALCEHTARVLAKGLDLLGIEAPERM